MSLSPPNRAPCAEQRSLAPPSWSLHLVLQVDAALGPEPECSDAELEQMALWVPSEPGVSKLVL